MPELIQPTTTSPAAAEPAPPPPSFTPNAMYISLPGDGEMDVDIYKLNSITQPSMTIGLQTNRISDMDGSCNLDSVSRPEFSLTNDPHITNIT